MLDNYYDKEYPKDRGMEIESQPIKPDTNEIGEREAREKSALYCGKCRLYDTCAMTTIDGERINCGYNIYLKVFLNKLGRLFNGSR